MTCNDRDLLTALLAGTLDDDSAHKLLRRLDEGDPALEALLASEDAELARAFGHRWTALSEISTPEPAHTDHAWARLQGAVERPNQNKRPLSPSEPHIAPTHHRRRRWAGRWTLGGLALASSALVAVGIGLEPDLTTPEPAERAIDGIKGSSGPHAFAAVNLRLELLREGPDGQRHRLGTPFRADTEDRIITRVGLDGPAWLYLIHHGPDGRIEVVPFAARRLPAGSHIPVSKGRIVAYDLAGEPGHHRFIVMATAEARPAGSLRAFAPTQADSPQSGVIWAEQSVEVR